MSERRWRGSKRTVPVVVCIDELAQIQALNRTRVRLPILPLRPGIPEKQTHDLPRVQLHVVCDNYATSKHLNVQAWLAKHPRVYMHFTPTSGSWLNMVEIFSGIIIRQAIRRGTFHSVADFETAIGAYIDGWNERAHPFTWTKSADEINAHTKPSPPQKKTYGTRH